MFYPALLFSVECFNPITEAILTEVQTAVLPHRVPPVGGSSLQFLHVVAIQGSSGGLREPDSSCQ